MVLLIYTDYSQNTLNISKLKSYIQNQNNIIKNYKIMCELLNEKVSGGGSTKKA